MALNIKSDRADHLARRVAQQTGETITQAVIVALEERLQRLERPHDQVRRAELRRIVEEAHKVAVRDHPPLDEIVGYNEHGAFD